VGHSGDYHFLDLEDCAGEGMEAFLARCGGSYVLVEEGSCLDGSAEGVVAVVENGVVGVVVYY